MQSLLQPSSSRVLLADGAWGTELLRLPGATLPVEQLNRTARPAVHRLAEAYLDAGARIIGANTFGVSRLVAQPQPGCDGVGLLIDALTLTVQGVGERAVVCPPLGPTGLRPGDEGYDAARIESLFEYQARHLMTMGLTCCAIETMSDPLEAAAAVRGAKARLHEVSCCYTFQRESDGALRTLSGATPEEAAAAALEAGASAVGANCCAGPDDVLDAIAAMHAAFPEVPLIARPNAGVPTGTMPDLVYPVGPQALADYVPRFIDAGARVIGGCCGTTPEHIRALAEAIPR